MDEAQRTQPRESLKEQEIQLLIHENKYLFTNLTKAINQWFMFCFLAEDNCTPNPCNDGTCENQIGGYTCQCKQGYTGRNCESRKHYDATYISLEAG